MDYQRSCQCVVWKDGHQRLCLYVGPLTVVFAGIVHLSLSVVFKCKRVGLAIPCEEVGEGLTR